MGSAAEDKWAWVKIGDPFPENPVRAKGEQNQYLALWYKNGKPVFGRAWNNGGVVECSFPYGKVELTGADQLGGQIQVLVHQGNYEKNGYWYDWIGIRDWRQDHLRLVHCGEAAPILAPKPDGGDKVVGNVFLSKEQAAVSYDGKAVELGPKELGSGSVLVPVRNFKPPLGYETKEPGSGSILIPVRNFKPPLGDEGEEEEGDGASSELGRYLRVDSDEVQAVKEGRDEDLGLGQLIVELGGVYGQDLFQEVRVGDIWPTYTVGAFTTSYESGRPLRTGPGQEEQSCVALWYQHGIPVMGRCWKDAEGKVRASFAWNGNEYTNAGSFQILRHNNAKSHGFEYKWFTYTDLKAELRNKSGWGPVHVANIAPCININPDGGWERLGKIDMFKEIASYGHDGTEHVTNGPAVAPFVILARRTLA